MIPAFEQCQFTLNVLWICKLPGADGLSKVCGCGATKIAAYHELLDAIEIQFDGELSDADYLQIEQYRKVAA